MTRTPKQNSMSTPSPTTKYLWLFGRNLPLSLVQCNDEYPTNIGKVVAGQRQGSRIGVSIPELQSYPLCLRVPFREASWEMMFHTDYPTTIEHLVTPPAYSVEAFYLPRTARTLVGIMQLTDVYRNHVVGVTVDSEERSVPRVLFEQEYLPASLQLWVEARLQY